MPNPIATPVKAVYENDVDSFTDGFYLVQTADGITFTQPLRKDFANFIVNAINNVEKMEEITKICDVIIQTHIPNTDNNSVIATSLVDDLIKLRKVK